LGTNHLTQHSKERSMIIARTVGPSRRRSLPGRLAALASLAALAIPAWASASELDLHIPKIDTHYHLFGATVSGFTLLLVGLIVCVLGMLFGLAMYRQVKGMPAHQSMLDVSAIIWETCKTYVIQQGRLLLVLEAFIAACIVYYFGFLQHQGPGKVLLIILWSV